MPQNYGISSSSNFTNLVLDNNTVTNGRLLDGGFKGTVGGWAGFLVENTTLGTGAQDINEYDQGYNVGLWTGTVRPTEGTAAFYQSGDVFNDYSGNSTLTLRFQSDLTILNSNSTSGPIAVTIDPTKLAGYPIGFTTTIYVESSKTNWTLKADPSWNTFSSDIPVGPDGVTIEVNSDGLFAIAGTTSTTVTSLANPAPLGQLVSFTALVGNNGLGSQTPTGTVTFMDGSTTLGTQTLDAGGQATFSTSTLSVGSHTITVTYSGDSNFATSAGQMTQTVGQLLTTTDATTSASPATLGQLVTFAATVSTGDSDMPSGGLTFFDGGTPLGTVLLDSAGHASFSTASLVAGSHTITASFAGTADFSTSSIQFTQLVSQPAKSTATALTRSANPLVVGQTVTFTATVKNGGNLVTTGTVTFLDGSTVLGVIALNAKGVAKFSTPSFAVGGHVITASYNGTTTFGTSAGQLTQTVNQANTAATVGATAATTLFDQWVTFTATVATKAAVAGIPTGIVTFFDGSTVLGTGTLNASGKATFSTCSLAVGSHTITVAYAGDANHAASLAKRAQTVRKATVATTLSSSIRSTAFGQSVTFTATVAAPGQRGNPDGKCDLPRRRHDHRRRRARRQWNGDLQHRGADHRQPHHHRLVRRNREFRRRRRHRGTFRRQGYRHDVAIEFGQFVALRRVGDADRDRHRQCSRFGGARGIGCLPRREKHLGHGHFGREWNGHVYDRNARHRQSSDHRVVHGRQEIRRLNRHDDAVGRSSAHNHDSDQFQSLAADRRSR